MEDWTERWEEEPLEEPPRAVPRAFREHEHLYILARYRVELFERGEKIGEWMTLVPLLPFAAGDLINPLGLPFKSWPGLRAVVEADMLLEVVRVEHLPTMLHGEMYDMLHVHCRRVPDTFVTRTKSPDRS